MRKPEQPMKPARRLEINGQRIACYESEGRGAVVFFIHSNSTSAAMFERQFHGRLGAKYRLIGIDLPGHGQSSPATDPGNTYSLPGYADIVVESSKALGAEDAIFIGWSLGGHILLEAAESLRKARGLMIFGTPPLGRPPQLDRAFAAGPALANIFKPELADDEIREWVAFQLRPQTGKDISRAFEEAVRHATGDARAFIGESLKNLEYRDELEAARRIRIPFAILHGEEDRCVNLDYLKEIGLPALWRDGIQVIPGAGHSPQLENSGDFDAVVDEFISDAGRYWERRSE